ncbi:MAG: hypothetical protein V4692_03810 [Bdellovibrionota bacterium]
MSDVAVMVTFAAGYVLTGMFVLSATISSMKPALQPVRIRSNRR